MLIHQSLLRVKTMQKLSLNQDICSGENDLVHLQHWDLGLKESRYVKSVYKDVFIVGSKTPQSILVHRLFHFLSFFFGSLLMEIGRDTCPTF